MTAAESSGGQASWGGQNAGGADSAAGDKKDLPKLVTLAVLHMAQYFPIAFTGVALPFMFRQQGMPLEMLWLLALPNMPRLFKFLMALVVDNYGSARFGRRKSWIVPCTMIGAATYASLAFVEPTLELVHIMVAILVVNAFVMGAQDIAVDAYAAESMTDAERPVGTALINLLGGVASVLSTAAIVLVDVLGWSTTMFASAFLLVVAAAPAMIRKEPPPPAASAAREARGERPSLIRALVRSDSWFILPFMFAFGFGPHFFLTILGPFWADQGLTLAQYGILAPVASVCGGILAATATPWLIARIGMARTATIGLAILPLEAAVYVYFDALAQLPMLATLTATIALLSFATAIFNYTVTISRFRWVSKAQAGTDYSLQSSFWNLGVWAGGSAAGFVAAFFGYAWFFPIAALLTIIGGVYYVTQFDRIEALVLAREAQELAQEESQPSGERALENAR
ncbi:MAG: MFS transporter [Pseudomonadota bacterium]